MVVEYVSEPVADWLPMLLLLVLATPFVTRIPINGVDVLVPLDVTPVKLTEAMVLLLIFGVVFTYTRKLKYQKR